MDSPGESGNRIPVLQLNSELQHAHMELLSAHCATYQLRLRYSAAELIRFGRRDLLRQSAEAASALNDFYSSLAKKISASAHPVAAAPSPTDVLVGQAVDYVAAYLREQRGTYLPAAIPLSNYYKARMWPYFSAQLLDHIRVVELHGERVPVPSFYAEARAKGFDNLPEITHMESLTFIDVLVFNEPLNERSLFHGLVHAVQFQAMGLERYTERFVQSFLRTGTHFNVPIEAHAFSLTSKFLRPSPEVFSVDEQVTSWINENRY